MAKGKALWEAQSLSMTSPASRPVLRTTSPKQSALATPTSQSLLQPLLPSVDRPWADDTGDKQGETSSPVMAVAVLVMG
ncbi:hypothetical protein PO909_027268 [Leuciscus waleckii]